MYLSPNYLLYVSHVIFNFIIGYNYMVPKDTGKYQITRL